jgi:hypothetical protein
MRVLAQVAYLLLVGLAEYEQIFAGPEKPDSHQMGMSIGAYAPQPDHAIFSQAPIDVNVSLLGQVKHTLAPSYRKLDSEPPA